MKGLFNKVKNAITSQRYVVSTIKKAEGCYETAVFEANFFYFPKHLSRPDLTRETPTKEAAWDFHYLMVSRLAQEYPLRLFQELAEDKES